MSVYRIKKTMAYLNHYGFFALAAKAMEKYTQREDYAAIREKEIASEHELEAQRNHSFPHTPLVSLLMPAYNTDPKALTETLESVFAQTYTNWQLCIADGGSKSVKEALDRVAGADKRISYQRLSENLGISGNSNAALKLATGEYVAILDHDDLLEPDALYRTMEKIILEDAEFVYTDEDKVNAECTQYFAPYRKPDYNQSLLWSNNYICHFAVIKRSLVTAIGGFRSAFDGAQDYDLFLRISEKTDRIAHVPKILYHWRTGGESTSNNPFNKNYATDAGKLALEAHFQRIGKKVRVESMADPGYFRAVPTESTQTSVGVFCNAKSAEAKMDFHDFFFIGDSLSQADVADLQKLAGRALLTSADLVVPKQLKRGRYYYNGLAKRGNGHTPSLIRKPGWYRGRFNLGVTNMDVHSVPVTGILVNKKALLALLQESGRTLSAIHGPGKDLKMVYAPEVVIKK